MACSDERPPATTAMRTRGVTAWSWSRPPGRACRPSACTWNGFDVRALDVLVEHDAVLGRLGHRLVDDDDVAGRDRLGLEAPRRPDPAGACGRSARRRCRGCWRDRSSPRSSCARASRARGSASRPGRPRRRPSSVRPAARVRAGPAVPSVARASSSVLPVRLGTRTWRRAGRDPERDGRADGRESCRPAGSVRVTLPLSVVSLASDL